MVECVSKMATICGDGFFGSTSSGMVLVAVVSGVMGQAVEWWVSWVGEWWVRKEGLAMYGVTPSSSSEEGPLLKYPPDSPLS